MRINPPAERASYSIKLEQVALRYLLLFIYWIFMTI